MPSKNWIKGAVKRPGALRAKAKRAGKITAKGTIDMRWLRAQAKVGGTLGKQARLAQTLRRLRK
jgi:hypothetical protein